MNAHGGKRPGAGRPTGAASRANEQVRQEAAATGELPLAYMLRIMRDPSQPVGRRDEVARAAAPFCHSRLSSVEHSGEIARPTVIRAPSVSGPQAALLACPVFEVFFGGSAAAPVPRSSRYHRDSERQENVLVTKLVANSGPRVGIERDGSARAADFRNTNQHLSGPNETGRNGHHLILSLKGDTFATRLISAHISFTTTRHDGGCAHNTYSLHFSSAHVK